MCFPFFILCSVNNAHKGMKQVKKSLELSANNPAMYCVAFGREKNQVSSNFFLKGETCVGLQEVNGLLS